MSRKSIPTGPDEVSPDRPEADDGDRRSLAKRRDTIERRLHDERRRAHVGPPDGEPTERRTGIDRRLPGDRRSFAERRRDRA